MKSTVRHLRQSLWALIPHLNGRADVPMRDIAVLLFLLEREEPTSSSDIQTALGIEQPKVVTITGRLAQVKLVEKYKDEHGRVVFSLTPEGKAIRNTLAHLQTPKRKANETP